MDYKCYFSIYSSPALMVIIFHSETEDEIERTAEQYARFHNELTYLYKEKL